MGLPGLFQPPGTSRSGDQLTKGPRRPGVSEREFLPAVINLQRGTDMKKTLTPLFPILLISTGASPLQTGQSPLTVKGFHLGMSRDAVQQVYNGLESAEVAAHISMEKENYRDLITLDTEFSSMGNKVEVAYDENETVTSITFQYKTVDILFDAGGEDAEAFVGRFCDEYRLPEMEMEDQGFVTLWTVVMEAGEYKVSIDSMKNLRIQKV